MVNSLEFKMDAAGVLTGTMEIDGRTMVTNVAKASLSAVAANRFTFAGFSVATGTITEPTTTAVATAATAVDGIKTFSLKVENSLVTDNYGGNNAGLKTRPVYGDVRKVTGEMTADYTSQIAAFRDAWKANGGIPLIWNFSNGADQLQFVVGYARLTDPVRPAVDGKQPEASLKWEALLSSAYTEGVWMVARTADAAL